MELKTGATLVCADDQLLSQAQLYSHVWMLLQLCVIFKKNNFFKQSFSECQCGLLAYNYGYHAQMHYPLCMNGHAVYWYWTESQFGHCPLCGSVNGNDIKYSNTALEEQKNTVLLFSEKTKHPGLSMCVNVSPHYQRSSEKRGSKYIHFETSAFPLHRLRDANIMEF